MALPKAQRRSYLQKRIRPYAKSKREIVPFLNLRGGANDPSFGEKHVVAVDFERFVQASGETRFLKVDNFILENRFEKKQINFFSRGAAHSQIPRMGRHSRLHE